MPAATTIQPANEPAAAGTSSATAVHALVSQHHIFYANIPSLTISNLIDGTSY